MKVKKKFISSLAQYGLSKVIKRRHNVGFLRKASFRTIATAHHTKQRRCSMNYGRALNTPTFRKGNDKRRTPKDPDPRSSKWETWCDGFNEDVPTGSRTRTPGPQWVVVFGEISECRLALGSISLEVGLGCLQSQPTCL